MFATVFLGLSLFCCDLSAFLNGTPKVTAVCCFLDKPPLGMNTRTLSHRDISSDAKLKASVVNAEIALRERERALTRFRARLTHAAAECAALAGSVGGAESEIQAMIEPMQVRDQSKCSYDLCPHAATEVF